MSSEMMDNKKQLGLFGELPPAMRALSLWEPWASLIAIGAKRYETRSWGIDYRGPVCIHASKRWTGGQLAITQGLRERYPVRLRKLPDENFPFGRIVCVAELVNCFVMTADHVATVTRGSGLEDAVGDWSPGRYAWLLENVRVLEPPIELTGRQRLWNVPEDVARTVAAALRL